MVAYSGPIKDESPRAFSNGTNIVVQWRSDDESGVLEYRISRKAGTGGAFFVIARIKPMGNGQLYEHVDNTAFRVTDSFYQYEIKAIMTNGAEGTPYYVSVSHNVSSVRRTWGSIKAMFR